MSSILTEDESSMQNITLLQADDCHIHLRDGALLERTVKDAAKQFARAIVMPNLVPPISTIEQAMAYRDRILRHLPEQSHFEPWMTLYLTEEMQPSLIEQASQTPYLAGVKLYPKGATTHSESGINEMKTLYALFESMQKHKVPLLIHGEVNDKTCDIFEREAQFINKHLVPLIHHFPELRIVFEHITTQEAVDFVLSAPATVAATITPHHLLMNRNDLLAGGIRPHHYCLPILKHAKHQEALLKAACSGNPKFFAGTDSAPHQQSQKESACGCAGIYTAHAALELYAEVFDQKNALDRLENFTSGFGAQFYGWKPSQKQVTLVKKEWQVPDTLSFGTDQLIPFRASEYIQWSYLEKP